MTTSATRPRDDPMVLDEGVRRGERAGVARMLTPAVDPSSRRTGGAILGDQANKAGLLEVPHLLRLAESWCHGPRFESRFGPVGP